MLRRLQIAPAPCGIGEKKARELGLILFKKVRAK
jgi:hypothetical protein